MRRSAGDQWRELAESLRAVGREIRDFARTPEGVWRLIVIVVFVALVAAALIP